MDNMITTRVQRRQLKRKEWPYTDGSRRVWRDPICENRAMKLSDIVLFEDREIHAKKIENAPAWSPAVAENDYKIGDITFSAGSGLGSVPHNKNVWYVGVLVFMKPSIFMSLALDDQGSQEPTSVELEKLVKEGYAVGIPFLDIKFDPAGKSLPKIMGHEGRGRVRMIRRVLGDAPIPVHLILRDGLRSRDVTADMVDEIKQGLYAEQSDRLVKNPVQEVYVDRTKR